MTLFLPESDEGGGLKWHRTYPSSKISVNIPYV
nr:MAG TPA: hypothetical protein [Caudoviricetes sp.]